MLNAYLRVFLMQVLLYVNSLCLWILFSKHLQKAVHGHWPQRTDSLRGKPSTPYKVLGWWMLPFSLAQYQGPSCFVTSPILSLLNRHQDTTDRFFFVRWYRLHWLVHGVLSFLERSMTERETGRLKDLKPQKDHVKRKERIEGQRLKKRGEERGEDKYIYPSWAIFIPTSTHDNILWKVYLFIFL